jgi:hypothetical protein
MTRKILIGMFSKNFICFTLTGRINDGGLLEVDRHRHTGTRAGLRAARAADPGGRERTQAGSGPQRTGKNVRVLAKYYVL